MINSIELPPPYEDEAAKISKELEEARKMIELLQAGKKRDEEKERKKELNEYAVALNKRILMTPMSCGLQINLFTSNYIFWEYLAELDETFIFASRNGNLLLTDKNLYITNYRYDNYVQNKNDSNRSQIQIQNKNNIMLCPLYTFDTPLTIKYLSMFNNNEFTNRFFNVVTYTDPSDMWFGLYDDGKYLSPTDKDKYFIHRRLHYIELMITTIPGSYKNKGWKNIGGFLGVYINDMKGLFQPYPPEREL